MGACSGFLFCFRNFGFKDTNCFFLYLSSNNTCISCIMGRILKASLTLSILNLSLSSSSTTSRELLSQFSTCSGWRCFEVGGKNKDNYLVLVNQFHGNFHSKTLGCRKIKCVFRDVKWCFNASWGLKGLKQVYLKFFPNHWFNTKRISKASLCLTRSLTHRFKTYNLNLLRGLFKPLTAGAAYIRVFIFY